MPAPSQQDEPGNGGGDGHVRRQSHVGARATRIGSYGYLSSGVSPVRADRGHGRPGTAPSCEAPAVADSECAASASGSHARPGLAGRTTVVAWQMKYSLTQDSFTLFITLPPAAPAARGIRGGDGGGGGKGGEGDGNLVGKVRLPDQPPPPPPTPPQPLLPSPCRRLSSSGNPLKG